MPTIPVHDAMIIGAGPAGLATSRELTRRGIGHVVLERGVVGQTWENLYDGLILHTGKHLSALPGMSFPRSTPLFPSRLDFVGYLNRYVEHFKLPVEMRTEVTSLRRAGDRWSIGTATGAELHSRAVVVATGIVANPVIPSITGRERFRGGLIHSVEYRRPDPFRLQRVLVVGAGNSAGEIAAELAASGAAVTVAIRSGARTVPRQLLGIPIQYFAVALSTFPRPVQRAVSDAMARASAALRGPAVLPPPRDGRCSEIPLIGFHLVDAIRAGTIRVKGAVAELTSTGARFADGTEELFDQIILATGYRPAVGLLGNQIRTDECGFAMRRARVVSSDQPDLYFVGHNYDVRGGLRNIAVDSRIVASRCVGGPPSLANVEPEP